MACGVKLRPTASTPRSGPNVSRAEGRHHVLGEGLDHIEPLVAALHRRFGFTQAGLLAGVGRKHGRWIDTLLMQKELESRGPTR